MYLKTIIASILLIIPFLSNAQVQEIEFPEIEIGIVEQLNDTIPLDLKFVNEVNDTVVLGDLITIPTILSFVYFDCPSICGPMQMGISDVLLKTDMKLGEDFQVITISFNPLDSPEKAIKKKANYVVDLPPENHDSWIYLTGEQKEITRITSAVGYRYKPTGFDFAHPSAIIIISPQGKITRYLYGITFLPFDVKMAVNEAQKGLARPTINKILEYCFSYDQEGRTYTLQVTRIVGTLVIAIALTIFLTLVIKRRRKTQKK